MLSYQLSLLNSYTTFLSVSAVLQLTAMLYSVASSGFSYSY